MIEHWEYKVGGVTNGTCESEQNILDREGKDRWELVSVIYHATPKDIGEDNTYFFYFKRRLLPAAPKKAVRRSRRPNRPAVGS